MTFMTPKAIFMSIFFTFGSAVSAQQPEYERVPSGIQIEALKGGLGAAPAHSPRKILKSAVELVKHFEGWFPEPYNDPVGYCTLGYGHLVALKRCSTVDLSEFDIPLTEKDGQALLLDDTRHARHAVERLVSINLTDHQFSALSSFVFNVGEGNFSKSTLLKLINSNDFNGAVKQFPRWVYARGVRLRGLEIRRGCEATLFSGSSLLNGQGSFVREKCTVLGATEVTGGPIDVIEGE